MSDLTANNRSSFGSTGAQNIMRPKFQPIRLKALLHFCESDDDDDDDDDDDNDIDHENKSKFSNELDSEPQLLPENEFIEGISQESFSCETVNPTDISIKKLSRAVTLLPEESRETEIIIMQKGTDCSNDMEKYKFDGVSSESHVPVRESSKLDISKNKEIIQECHSGTVVLKIHQVDVDQCSTDMALPSSSVYKGDHNEKCDVNRNLQSTSSAQQSYRESAYAQEASSKRKEELTYGTSSDTKKQLAKNNENYPLNLSKEEQWHKGTHGLIKQMSKDREEEYRRGTSSSVSAEFATFGNSVASAGKYGSTQYNVTAKYSETNEKPTESNARPQFSTPSLTTISSRSVTGTPLKHAVHVGPTHPHLYLSHKQLFRTPQSKPSSCEQSSKSHVQTPSTILFNWSSHSSNAKHTPMHGKNLISKDRVQTPQNAIYTPVVGKQEPLRFFEVDVKNKRRPLTDSALVHSDSSIYPLESKSLLLQTHSEAKSYVATSELQQEDKNKRITTPCSEIKTIEIETKYDSDLKSSSIEETKENKQPNIPDALIKDSREIAHDKREGIQIVIDSDIGLKAIQDSSSNVERKDPRNYCSMHEKQREELGQIVDKVANVQISVPSSVRPQQFGKTLYLKNKEYVILGSLGRGMSGEVLRVQDVSCGELRAIKCVDLSKMDKESAQGCLDEISLLRKLQAPCVVRMFDYHIKESIVYVVMEMGDTDLSRLLKSMSQEKQIPFTMILYYWTEMLTAVKHIHDNGVIHSDLKPANFLLVRGRLKLIDFGIASNINSDMTSVLKNNPIGTLNYISPEALMDIGENTDSPTHNVKYKISFKSDVWSLGCILYSLVYGHTPFHHIRSQWAKVNAITNPKLNILFPTTTFSSGDNLGCEYVPPVLIDGMRKCLQHDPKVRPTVSQLLQVQYVPTGQNVAPISVPEVPANILVKIKHALKEEEWRQLIMVLDTKRHHT